MAFVAYRIVNSELLQSLFLKFFWLQEIRLPGWHNTPVFNVKCRNSTFFNGVNRKELFNIFSLGCFLILEFQFWQCLKVLLNLLQFRSPLPSIAAFPFTLLYRDGYRGDEWGHSHP